MSGKEVLNEYNDMLNETIANLDEKHHELGLAREVHKELCVAGGSPDAINLAWTEVLDHSRVYTFLKHRINQLSGRIRIWGERLGLAA
ncbi:hypothetical protein KAR91_63050 [Candidatus Pacearchaeota archaeon]|nr:hypothetical protein [Candidatus Pacearchaeota archaeon]